MCIRDRLNRDGENSHIVALGAYGFGKVIEIDTFGDIGSVWDIGEGIRNVMTEGNATATVVQHVGVPAGPLTLFVGTDVGLFKVETASARDSATPNWIFYQSPEPTSVASNFDQLRSLGTQGTGNPATVNALVADGFANDDHQVLWIGTPSGLHSLTYWIIY